MAKTTNDLNLIFLLKVSICATLIFACSNLDETRSGFNTENKGSFPTDSAKNVVYVIDGKFIENTDDQGRLPGLKSENISSVHVLKSKEASAKYGVPPGKKVIEITTVQADKKNYIVVEEEPEIEGGASSLFRVLEYPSSARIAGIEGTVVVKFVVDENGEAVDPYVVRGIGGGCDEAALRAVKQVKFKPYIQNGKKLPAQFTMPIIFRLSK